MNFDAVSGIVLPPFLISYCLAFFILDSFAIVFTFSYFLPPFTGKGVLSFVDFFEVV
jgi:hypothetical protein